MDGPTQRVADTAASLPCHIPVSAPKIVHKSHHIRRSRIRHARRQPGILQSRSARPPANFALLIPCWVVGCTPRAGSDVSANPNRLPGGWRGARGGFRRSVQPEPAAAWGAWVAGWGTPGRFRVHQPNANRRLCGAGPIWIVVVDTRIRVWNSIDLSFATQLAPGLPFGLTGNLPAWPADIVAMPTIPPTPTRRMLAPAWSTAAPVDHAADYERNRTRAPILDDQTAGTRQGLQRGTVQTLAGGWAPRRSSGRRLPAQQPARGTLLGAIGRFRWRSQGNPPPIGLFCPADSWRTGGLGATSPGQTPFPRAGRGVARRASQAPSNG